MRTYLNYLLICQDQISIVLPGSCASQENSRTECSLHSEKNLDVGRCIRGIGEGISVSEYSPRVLQRAGRPVLREQRTVLTQNIGLKVKLQARLGGFGPIAPPFLCLSKRVGSGRLPGNSGLCNRALFSSGRKFLLRTHSLLHPGDRTRRRSICQDTIRYS